MKMKINKACDLSSISVLPPHTKRPNTVPSGFQSSQPRSQPSQQAFSHGLSSQHAMLSQFSQNSLDEAVTNDQRVGSQERQNSARRSSCLPGLTYSREESQPPNMRSSSNLMRKWNSADHKSQLSEGLEHQIGMMETSLSRFAMILDSVQSEVMQVNKGTKEVNIEMEYMRQKLIAHDNSLQLMTRGHEEIKASIDGSLKSLSEQMSNVTSQDKLQEVFLVVSTLPQLIEASLQSLQYELRNTLTKEMQEISCSLKSLNQKDLGQSVLSTKTTGNQDTMQKKPQPHANEAKISVQATVAPKVDMGGWKRVQKPRVTFSDKSSEKKHKQRKQCTEKYLRGVRSCPIVIESDEETAGCFSCLDEENADLYGNLTKEEEEETERILQKARRRKRKYPNAVVIY